MNAKYIETETLVFAMEKCEESAKENLRRMTPRERKQLQDTLLRLDNWIDQVDGEPTTPTTDAA